MKWLLELLSDDSAAAPVIRGLNLALPLAEPAKLPLLLWDIAAAQPKIQRAIRELSFLHFARFVPSWDGTALMVITEFDGPLDDYVLDFAIVIGDVFDRLLSYVASPPPLPVCDNHTAFLTWVRQWNRLPYGPRRSPHRPSLLPSIFEPPVYKAYPNKTVLDICVGAEFQRPRQPVIDGPAAVIDFADVQGNILKGYRAERSVHLFLSVDKPQKARRWLAKDFPSPTSAWKGVMSANSWEKGEQIVKPEVAANIGFTAGGLRKLMPWREQDLATFPAAFKQGARTRAEDNGDVNQPPKEWRFGGPDTDVDIVISLFGFDTANAEPATPFDEVCAALRKACALHGLHIVCEQAGGSHSTKLFGFTDAISQPRVAGTDDAGKPGEVLPAASPGEFLLGKRYLNVYGGTSLRDMPKDLARNGSFGVMRLYELHEDALREAEASKAAAEANIGPDMVRARLMGRWQNGDPLSLGIHPPEPPAALNDFDYAPSWEYPQVQDDNRGATCPLGAHIRRVNPRSAHVPGLRHSRRLIRRGVPTTLKDASNATSRQGLLGLFFCADIERQFEFIQRHWIQDSAANSQRGTQDPIAGIRRSDQTTPFELMPAGHGRAAVNIDVKPLVTLHGSLYLFYPGLGMLKHLRKPRDPDTQANDCKHPVGRLQALPARALPPLQKWLQRSGERVLYRALQRGADVVLNENRLLRWRDKLEEWIPQLLPTVFAGPPRQQAEQAAKLPVSPTSAAFLAEPYASGFKPLLAKGDVVTWVPEHHAFWVFGQAAGAAVMATHDEFHQAPSTARLRGILRQDGHRHTEVRQAVVQAFTIATQHVDGTIEQVLEDVLPRLHDLPQFDFVREFAQPVPRRVFWRFYGLPADAVDEADRLAQTMMRLYKLPEPDRAASRNGFTDCMLRLSYCIAGALVRAWVDDLKPGDGSGAFDGTLIGEIARRTQIDFSELPLDLPVPPQLFRLRLPARQRPLAALESLAILMQVVLAGYMSTQFLAASTMLNLLRPDPRAGREKPWVTLHENLTLLDGALHEALRFDPPMSVVERYIARNWTDEEIDALEGQPLYDVLNAVRKSGIEPEKMKDCPVHVVVASANRDGNGLDEFRLDRGPAASLSLGHGVHECIGRVLQQKITRLSFDKLLREFKHLRLCAPNAVPAWGDNFYFRSLLTLPVAKK
ncbi:hypothetical protein [Roseateles sp. BYS78W]|uniref:hypothetical protein n=1 Tax=Pelomonas candidula TaxID=3299025 RepID=UPI00374A655E